MSGRIGGTGEKIKSPGLEATLSHEFPMNQIKTADIPEGANSQEIWTIFDEIYQIMEEGDEVYFDITHAFRSISMMTLAVLNYARVLKNIQIKGIYYGAFENQFADEEGRKIAPILDVTPFVSIFDWTNAANSFIKFGHGGPINALCVQSRSEEPWMRPFGEIANLTNAVDASMGKYITGRKLPNQNTSYKSSIYNAYLNFKNKTVEVDAPEWIAAMVNPLFEKVKEKASAFDHPDSVGIGWAAVEWSIDNNMVQQGFTALQETIITFMCQHYALAEDDYLEYHNREHISKSFTSIIKKNPKNCSKFERNRAIDSLDTDHYFSKCSSRQLDLLNRFMYEVPDTLIAKFNDIRKIRNQMSHFGFNDEFKTYGKIKENLEDYYHIVRDILEHYERFKRK